MEGVQAPGGGASGLDVRGLVDQLISAEGAPATGRLDRQEVQVQASLSALGTFRGALSEFQATVEKLRDPEDLRKISATSSDEEAVEVSSNNLAQEGRYQVEVKQLAQAHRLMSEAFESPLEAIGVGNLTIQFGSVDETTNRFLVNENARVKNISITKDNNSLRGIEKQINDANAGIRASIINDGVGHRLVLSAAGTGSDSNIRITVNDKDGNNNDQNGLSKFAYDVIGKTGPVMNLIETTESQDARLTIDGIDILSSSNTVADAIDGVTLSLNAITNAPVKVKTEFDTPAVLADIDAFIQSYNEMISIINSISGVNEETGEAGPLAGDASIRGISSQIRRTMTASFANVNEQYESLGSIGIETQRDGSLTINSGKLQSAIDNNLIEVSQLFARSGSTSDPLVQFVTAGRDSKMGRYDINVNQKATQGRYVGQVLTQPKEFSVVEGEREFLLQVDGVTSSSISLSSGVYSSGKDLADEMQRKINQDNVFQREGVAVSVQFVLDQFVVTSKKFGAASKLEFIKIDDGLANSIGFDVEKGIDGTDMLGTIGRVSADASGQTLIGRGDSSGIKVNIVGGEAGSRGTVNFSQGVAEQLHNMLSSYLDSNGILSSRDDGFNGRIEDIAKQRGQLARRLESAESRYLTQFSALDGLMGKMRNTSEFLSGQLANLPGAQKK